MSRNTRSRYQNTLGVPWLGFFVAAGLVGLAFGFAYVYLMNQRHLQEGEKLALAEEIQNLGGEAERLRIDASTLAAAENLRPLFERSGSDLVETPSGDVIQLGTPPPDRQDPGL